MSRARLEQRFKSSQALAFDEETLTRQALPGADEYSSFA